ncbi:MAG: phosphotransferase [Lachnospiraceae bacterium]|nr:phosphotransferase [Lachnospiraceae bacterium]
MDGVRLKETGKNTVVISFEGRISRDNAEKVGEDLTHIRSENNEEQLVFDFEKLGYISSAGLRVLLKAAKKEKNKIQIFNIPLEIYDILEDTGFVRMFETHKAMKKYSLSDFEMIGQGANGEVYRVDNENVIKVFQKSAPLEEIDRERTLAQESLLAGIPTAISYSVVMADDRYGIMFEMINADTLSNTLKNNPDRYDELAEKYVSLYKKIHETPVDKECFPSIKELYRDIITECEPWYTPEETAKLRALVESVPDRDTMIHGDYHPNNVMFQDDDLIIIDMGDVSYGHPIFDFLATAATQVNLVKLSPEYAEMHTRMPVELIKKTWDRLIEKYFGEYDKEERTRIEEQIAMFSKLKVAMAPHFGRGASPEIIKASIDDAKANFLPEIDKLIGKVDW